jgi:hypothetical protein
MWSWNSHSTRFLFNASKFHFYTSNDEIMGNFSLKALQVCRVLVAQLANPPHVAP